MTVLLHTLTVPPRADEKFNSFLKDAVSSVKLHVRIGKYWVSLYVLVCMVVCIMERIGMY